MIYFYKLDGTLVSFNSFLSNNELFLSACDSFLSTCDLSISDCDSFDLLLRICGSVPSIYDLFLILLDAALNSFNSFLSNN